MGAKKSALQVLVIASSVALALTGCSSSDNSTATGSASTAASDGPVTITWLHRVPDKKGATTVDELVAEFNESHPNIHVTAERMQGSAAESYAKINSIVSAGKDVPCLTQVGIERVPDMISSLMDVSEYTEQYKDNFIPVFYDKARVGDKVYGFPFGVSPMVFFYRADLFDKYGIEVPKTWDDYEQAARTIKEKSNGATHMGAFLTDEPLWLSALTSTEGANWFGYDKDSQEWSVTIDTPESQKVADRLDSLVKDDLMVPMQRWGQDFGKAIADGSLATTIGGSWEAPLIADTAPETKGLWRVAQIPHFDASTTTAGQNGGTIGTVLKGCEHPKEAIEFANWWATNIDGLTGLGLMPGAKVDSITTSDQLKEFFGGQAVYDEFVTANNNAPTVNWAPKVAATMKTLSDKQGLVGQGGTVRDELAAAQAEAEKSLSEAGLKVKK